MIKFLLPLLFAVSNAWALEAVVTVLETPMLKEKSLDADVVQYLRKGDVVKIHPSINNNRSFDKLAPSPEKRALLKKRMQDSSEWKQDPMFKGEEENTFYAEDEFIPALDRQGNRVWLITDHLYIYFNDYREFSQRTLRKDPTDYRLEEPLPKDYPLERVSGYRGQFLLGITQPYYESYDYKDNFKSKGYSSPWDLNYTYLRQAPGNYSERLFIGGTGNIRTFENSYTFYDRRLSSEKGLKMGLGPTISYDAYKGEKNRINLSATIMFYLFNQLSIKQSLDGIEDNRTYRGYSMAPRLSLQYHRKEVFEEIDFILGTSIETETATTFRAKNPGTQDSWWQGLGNDQFTTRMTYTISGYLGFQTAY